MENLKKKKEKNILLKLFFTFFKIGLFTFGGGYAMVAIIEDICVERNKWITNGEMLDLTVIAESTPGPIAINCATYIGYKKAGILGSIIATLGIVLPSFLIILLISLCMDKFLEFTLVQKAFKGIKIAVGVIILQAGIKLFKKMEKTKMSVIIFTLSTVIMTALDIFAINMSYIPIIIFFAILNLVVYKIGEIKKKEGNNA